MRLLKTLLVLFVCAASPAAAGPFEDGRAAYDRGDYATALRLWRPLAEQGNPGAQYNLGGMYASSRGVSQGVPHDLVQAYKWLSLAASRAQGNDLRENAIKARDLVAAAMTPARIAEAQKLAREWKPR
jgi:TPR repeat protein